MGYYFSIGSFQALSSVFVIHFLHQLNILTLLFPVRPELNTPKENSLFLFVYYNEAPGLAGLLGAVPGLCKRLPPKAAECLAFELLN